MSVNFSIEKYSLVMGGKQLLTNTKLVIAQNTLYALVGRNGTGKTSLLMDIKSRQESYYVSQEIISTEQSVFNQILSTDKQLWEIKQAIDKIENADEDLDVDQLNELYEIWSEKDYDRRESTLHRILHGLGFNDEQRHQPVNSFSGGWRMRISLASALFIEPKLLLLDEPTNHLDINGVIWLMDYLVNWKNTLIVVSHDTEFIQTVCNNIILLENQQLHYYRCRYHKFVLQHNKELEKQQKDWEKYSKSLREYKKKGKSKNAVEQWIKQHEVQRPPLLKQARIDLLDLDLKKDEWEQVIDLKGVSFWYKEGATLFQNIDLSLTLGDRITIVGANGVGKSTLLRLMTDELKPTAGRIDKNQKLHIGYYHQHTGDILPNNENPISYLQRVHSFKPEKIREWLGKIGIPGGIHTKDISTLSGGQKARVALIDILMGNPHLLLLDEPTNHLDAETIDVLTDTLREYKGAILVITHSINFIEGLDCKIYHLQRGALEETEYDDYCQLVLNDH